MLGWLTIVAYGSWYYGFGVLIDAIRRDEGWSIAALGTVFGATILINGVGAAPKTAGKQTAPRAHLFGGRGAA